MVIDWIAAGLDPEQCTIFIQSRLPEHAELFTLLAMGTPLGWLERVPTYKDQIEKLKDRDLATYGFLGYPLLQAADILIYKASYVPVGEDQASHVELTREVARRFNHLYGRGADFESRRRRRAGQAAARTTRATSRSSARPSARPAPPRRWPRAKASCARPPPASPAGPRPTANCCSATCAAAARPSSIEPQALHTEVTKLPGLDGAKMSKSYGNAVLMRDEPAAVEKKIRGMPTDPARVRRSDPGDPEKCPVWQFHQVYSDAPTQGLGRQGLHDAPASAASTASSR